MHSITWALAAIFYAFQMSIRVMPPFAVDHIVREFHFTSVTIGFLTSIYYLGYCLAHIPIGILLDRFNPKYTLVSSILLCLIGIYCTESTDSMMAIFFGRFLIGIGSAGGILGAVKVMYDFYPQNYSFMLGLTILVGILGSSYSEIPLNKMLLALSYEQLMQSLILFGLILAASIFAFYQSPPPTPLSIHLPLRNLLLSILGDKKLILVGIYSGLMVGSLEGLTSIWGRNFLVQIHGLTEVQAAHHINLMFIGLGLGCVAAGYIYPKIQDISKFVSYIGAIMLVSLIALLYNNTSNIFTYLIFFIIGCCSSYQIFSFAMINKFIPPQTIGLSTAILNMIIMSFGLVYHSIIGFTLDTFFISESFGQIIYSQEAYKAAFTPLVIGIALGAWGFSRLKVK